MVAAAPSGGPEAYYENGSQDGSRPGVFYVNLNPLESQKKYEAVTLSLHEGNPGHNYQFVFNKQQKDLPRFMANPMFTRWTDIEFLSQNYLFISKLSPQVLRGTK